MTWPEPDWTPVPGFPTAKAELTFTGERRRDFLSLRYFKKGQTLLALVSFGKLSQGAPGQAHGGAILTVLDEALGAAAWAAGHRVLTARLTAEFRRTVPVGSELMIETRIVAAKRRIVDVEGSLTGRDGAVHATAAGRFVTPSAEIEKRFFL